MATNFLMIRDLAGYNSFLLPPIASSSFKKNTILSASAEQTLTVPADVNTWIAIFRFENGSDVWTALNATATLPTSSFASTNSSLNLPGLIVNANDILHFITADTTAEVDVEFYAYTQQ